MFNKLIPNDTCGLVAMTSASHAEGRQFDPGQVYIWHSDVQHSIPPFTSRSRLAIRYRSLLVAPGQRPRWLGSWLVRPCWCVRLLPGTLVGGFLAGALAAGLLADALADGLLACALAGCLLTCALAGWPPLLAP